MENTTQKTLYITPKKTTPVIHKSTQEKEPIKENAQVPERITDIETKINESELKQQVQEIYEQYYLSAFLTKNKMGLVSDIHNLSIPNMQKLIEAVNSGKYGSQITERKRNLKDTTPTKASFQDSIRNIGMKTPTPKKSSNQSINSAQTDNETQNTGVPTRSIYIKPNDVKTRLSK